MPYSSALLALNLEQPPRRLIAASVAFVQEPSSKKAVFTRFKYIELLANLFLLPVFDKLFSTIINGTILTVGRNEVLGACLADSDGSATTTEAAHMFRGSRYNILSESGHIASEHPDGK